MSKFVSVARLSRVDSQELFIEFCHYLSELHTPQEIAAAIGDLLTAQEVTMVAKRLKIAIFLIEGSNYAFIRSRLKVGNSTIARINLWLREAGEGFRMLYERGRKYRGKHRPPSAAEREWRRFRRRYQLYFWPQI